MKNIKKIALVSLVIAFGSSASFAAEDQRFTQKADDILICLPASQKEVRQYRNVLHKRISSGQAVKCIPYHDLDEPTLEEKLELSSKVGDGVKLGGVSWR